MSMTRWLLAVCCCCAMPLQAKEWLIDVRTPAEYASGHLDGAINIEYQQIVAKAVALGIHKDEPVRLYCRSGRRAALAQTALQQQGYQQVEDLGSLEQASARLQRSASMAKQ